MKHSHLNRLWSQLLIEELLRCGVGCFCISPGSRNSPLVLAIADHERAESLVHYDERGAAFQALGFAQATGLPAAVVCTSGTAVANCYPAVVESSIARIPLLILSCDRPVELRDTGARQTINQVGIFGDYLRWFFDLPCPDAAISPAFLLTTADQAVFRALSSPPGPVQLNCQFREPLVSSSRRGSYDDYLTPVGRWLDSPSPYTSYTKGPPVLDDERLRRVASRLKSANRGLIVAGRMPVAGDKSEVVELAEKLGWPLLADITSGVRFQNRQSGLILSHFDLFLRSEDFRRSQRPDLVLHLGGAAQSTPLQLYLESSGAQLILVADHPNRQDPSHIVSERIEADPAVFAAGVAGNVEASESGLTAAFCLAERQVAAVVREKLNNCQSISETAVAYWIARLAPADSGLFLASSMPIRDMEAVSGCRAERIWVAANRGANGIDGTLATASGFARGLAKATTVLLGDLALLHDLNSLSLVRNCPAPVTIAAINNDGGGIFSFLPVSKIENHFEKYFAAPHRLNFKSAADMFDLPYYEARGTEEFRSVYSGAVASGQSSLIEVRSNRRANLEEHRDLWNRVSESIRERLESEF